MQRARACCPEPSDRQVWLTSPARFRQGRVLVRVPDSRQRCCRARVHCAPARAQVPTLAPPFTALLGQRPRHAAGRADPPRRPHAEGGHDRPAADRRRGQQRRRARCTRSASCATPQGHISGFVGTATRYADAAYNDGGVAYGPGSVLFLARWPSNELGQTKPGSTITDKIIDAHARSAIESLARRARASCRRAARAPGSLKLASYSGGEWYDAGVAPDGAGTYNLAAPREVAGLDAPRRRRRLRLRRRRARAQFTRPSMLVSEYQADEVAAYAVDANGDPIVVHAPHVHHRARAAPTARSSTRSPATSCSRPSAAATAWSSSAASPARCRRRSPARTVNALPAERHREDQAAGQEAASRRSRPASSSRSARRSTRPRAA